MIKMNKNTGNGDTFFVYAIKSNKTEIVEQFIRFFSDNNSSNELDYAYLKDGFSYLPLLPLISVNYLLNLCKEKRLPIDSTPTIDKHFKNCLVEDFTCDSIIKGENFITSDILIIGGNLKSSSKLEQNYYKDVFISFIKFNQIERILKYDRCKLFKIFETHELEIVTNITKYIRMDIFKYLLTEIHLPFNLQTVLKLGCQEGNQEMVFYLINNFYILDSEMLLKYVFESSNLELVKSIISDNRFEINKDAAITFALKKGRHDIFKSISKSVTDLNFYQPIYNNLTILYLLKENSNNDSLKQALFNIVETANWDMFIFFMEFNDSSIFNEKNERNENLLFSCCLNSSNETFKIFDYLYNTKRLSLTDVNTEENSEGQIVHYNVLEYAILHENFVLINKYLNEFKNIISTKACELLCKKEENLDLFKTFYDIHKQQNLNNVLVAAVKSGNIPIFDYLRQNTNISLNNIDGYSLLHYSAMSGNVSMFKLILCLDHNLLRAKGNNEETPIFCAIEKGRFDLFKYIYEQFPETMNDKNCLKSSILHFAFLYEQEEIIEYLLKDKKLSMEELNCDNRTPFVEENFLP